MEKKVRILIVDDSRLVRDILKDIFAQDDGLEVIGEACNGHEALQMTKQLRPDILTMDIQMPDMDGFEATEQIMAYCPTPILIFSSAIDKSEQYTSFKAIALGALDNMSKPDITMEGFRDVAAQLVKKIKMLSNIRVIPHIRGKLKHQHVPEAVPEAETESRDSLMEPIQRLLQGYAEPHLPAETNCRVIAVGASTGGPMALERMLSRFPADFPVGIVVVQHMARGFMDSYCEWLDNKIALTVKVAEQGERIQGGVVYFAPDDVQLEIAEDNTICLLRNAPQWGEFKPSVNHLFKSAAQSLGTAAIGVILTGMGSDGAEGMQYLYDCRAHTIAQDQATSLIYGMPRAAVENNCVRAVLPLDQIPEAIFAQIRE